MPYSLTSLWKIGKRISQLSPFHHTTWQQPRESPRHVRGSARIYDVRMAQFVLNIEKLSHIMGLRASQDLRSPSLIMAPVYNQLNRCWQCRWLFLEICITSIIYVNSNHHMCIRTAGETKLTLRGFLSLIVSYVSISLHRRGGRSARG